MSTKNKNSGNYADPGYWIGLWSVLAVAFHYAKLGDFADWPVIASPTTWSCLSIFIWSVIVALSVLSLVAIFSILTIVLRNRQKKKCEKREAKNGIYEANDGIDK